MNIITLALSLLTAPIAVQDTAGTGLNSIGMKMIAVEPGVFLMGSAGIGMNYDEAPAHTVTIPEMFRISATEVTNRQFEDTPHSGERTDFLPETTKPSYMSATTKRRHSANGCPPRREKSTGCRRRPNGNMRAGRAPWVLTP